MNNKCLINNDVNFFHKSFDIKYYNGIVCFSNFFHRKKLRHRGFKNKVQLFDEYL